MSAISVVSTSSTQYHGSFKPWVHRWVSLSGTFTYFRSHHWALFIHFSSLSFFISAMAPLLASGTMVALSASPCLSHGVLEGAGKGWQEQMRWVEMKSIQHHHRHLEVGEFLFNEQFQFFKRELFQSISTISKQIFISYEDILSLIHLKWVGTGRKRPGCYYWLSL